MALNCGIVGLPNVGKSTLFKGLTSLSVPIENYPFCTIDSNVGVVEVPDERITVLEEVYNPKKTVRSTCEFVDIAGLVKGASKGEGLGNQFLANIRNTGVIIHVLRCFEDENIARVGESADPLDDLETIKTELALADEQTITRHQEKLEKEIKKVSGGERSRMRQFISHLDLAKDAVLKHENLRRMFLQRDEQELINSLNLFNTKPEIYLCNVSEDDMVYGNELVVRVADQANKDRVDCIVVCAKFEADITQYNKEDREKLLVDLGMQETGLDMLVKSAYHLLGLRTFFTAGEKEVHAWTFRDGMYAPDLAGIIHTDFKRGFIRAEVFSYDDLVLYKNEQNLRSLGKVRTEGKEYEGRDGDIIHFRFNV